MNKDIYPISVSSGNYSNLSVTDSIFASFRFILKFKFESGRQHLAVKGKIGTSTRTYTFYFKGTVHSKNENGHFLAPTQRF